MSIGHIKPGVGIAWYSEQEYSRVRDLMADAEAMHDTFDQWHESARQLAEMVEAKGLTVRRVYLNAEEFLAWCSDRGLRADSKARARFTTERAAEQDRIWGGSLI